MRQEFIYRLHTQWGYPLEQMRQEVRTQRGRGSTRADIVVAESPSAARDNRDWRIVVETKAENVPINPIDYGQGESYGRAIGAEFLVMHNQKETAYCRLVPGAPGERVEIAGVPNASEINDSKRLDEIRRSTKVFTRDEFQRLLFECHSILRDNHKMDPGAAFDEISKILFIKMAYERQGHSELFTTDRLRQFAQASLLGPDDPAVLDQLFESTKKHYRADKLFGESETLRVSLATFKRIVSKLEKFNLSDTGDDVKGIAFERFLGQTFRGELGQFFTPRPLVDFMVEMLNPQEDEIICDPASGTGGFLIRAFEYLRSRLEQEVQRDKAVAIEAADKLAATEGWSEDQLVARLEQIQSELNRQLDVTNPESRLYNIAHNCIYGTDAEARAARTSKMNMIMHGDGHGGIHYHDGLLDVNGIYEGRFHLVFTNPPFGASVGKDQIIGATEQTTVEAEPDLVQAYRKRYGDDWKLSHDRLTRAAKDRRPLLELFDIGRDPVGAPIGAAKVRPSRATEQLFIERCLNLLQPGGRMAIVLPDGILNNPSLAWLREYVENRARLLAVVSVPQAVFASSKATVKTSIVFMRRFTTKQECEWRDAVETAKREAAKQFADQRRYVAALHQAAAEGGADKRRLANEAAKAGRELDQLEANFVRSHARELTTYPVFMAEVEHAGITSTGETGDRVPNELPDIVASYRRFENDPDAFIAEVAMRLAQGNEPTAES